MNITRALAAEVVATRCTVYLVHTRSRAAGGEPSQSAEVYGNGVGDNDGSAATRPVAELFATRLLGAPTAALAASGSRARSPASRSPSRATSPSPSPTIT